MYKHENRRIKTDCLLDLSTYLKCLAGICPGELHGLPRFARNDDTGLFMNTVLGRFVGFKLIWQPQSTSTKTDTHKQYEDIPLQGEFICIFYALSLI